MTRNAGLITIALVLGLAIAGVDVRANSAGSGTCFVNGVATPHPTFPSPGDGGFSLSAPAAYMPETTIQITLSGSGSFEGILIYALDEPMARVGEWQNIALGYQIKTGCPGDALATLTHTSSTGKAVPVVFDWKAPPALSGTVTFEALVLTGISTYFNISGLQLAESIFLDGFE